MDLTEEWRKMADVVVTKLKSDLKKAPNNEEHRKAAQEVMTASVRR